MRKNIIFCGGGSGGHVLPALTLLKKIQLEFPQVNVSCFGSYEGIESVVLAKYNYHGISTGKLRRYLSFENLLDIFRVFLGIGQAYIKLFGFKNRQTLVISTGGFVSIPVVIAAWLQGKPIVLHEQTTRAGLANRIASFFCDKCFLTFEESLIFFPKDKSICTGYPLRQEIFEDVTSEPLFEGYSNNGNLPILFVTGGGNGSKLLNDSLREVLPELCQSFYVIHQCGKVYLEEFQKLDSHNYKAFGFIGDEMIPIVKKSAVMVSRAGAGTVCELLAIGKPTILIPLKIAQKNEQLHNANVAKRTLGSIVIEEDDLSSMTLTESIESIQNLDKKKTATHNPADIILKKISNIK